MKVDAPAEPCTSFDMDATLSRGATVTIIAFLTPVTLALVANGCRCDAKPGDAGATASASAEPSEVDPAAAASKLLKQARAGASAAAQRLPDGGAQSPCEQAYAELKAMVDSVRSSRGRPDKSELELPQRHAFLASCESLPVDVQPCMKLSHALANSDTCQTAIDALPEPQRAKARVLLKPKQQQ